ncbi:MAG: hypothetical protein DCC55_25700 [Chloroflexi bacterium]|nr:MAG: hypothetical protein DCC55_25700 [Chloroflexota bacterium]
MPTTETNLQMIDQRPAPPARNKPLSYYLIRSVEYRRHFHDLCETQQRQLEDGDPLSPIPLQWVALAELAGLTVDLETGRIVDGPKNRPSTFVQ